MGISFLIARSHGPHRMLSAVYFDNEARAKAGEVNNKLVDWNLAPKMMTDRAQFAKPYP